MPKTLWIGDVGGCELSKDKGSVTRTYSYERGGKKNHGEVRNLLHR